MCVCVFLASRRFPLHDQGSQWRSVLCGVIKISTHRIIYYTLCATKNKVWLLLLVFHLLRFRYDIVPFLQNESNLSTK